MFSPIANCKWCTSILSAGKQCSYLIKWTFDIINALKTAKMASLWSSTHVLNLFSDFNIKIHAAFWVAPTTSLKWVHIFHLNDVIKLLFFTNQSNKSFYSWIQSVAEHFSFSFSRQLLHRRLCSFLDAKLKEEERRCCQQHELHD